jgi:hypothetical protein
MSTSFEKYFQKIQKLIENKASEYSNLSFPCKYMVFHQAKKYCKECEDFICDKCIKKHDSSHNLIKIEEIIKNSSQKMNLYLEVSKGKFPIESNNNNSIEYIEYDEKIEQNSLEKIDDLINKLICIKKKMLKFFELRKELLKRHISKDLSIVNKGDLMDRITKPEKLEIKEIDEKEIKNIHDIIKYEKKNLIVFKTFIDFCKDLDYKTNEIMKNNDYIKKLNKKEKMSLYERINLKTNELNLIMCDSFIHEVETFIKKSIPLIDSKILLTEDVFKNVVCAYLKIENAEYNSLLEKTLIEDEPKKISEKIVEVPKEVEKIVEKTIEVPVNKTKFSLNELSINTNNKINLFFGSSNTDDKIDVDSENFNINDLIEKNENNSEINSNTDNNNTLNENMNQKSQLKRTTVIQKKGEISGYASLTLSTQNVKDILRGTYNEAKAVILIKDNKFLIDSNEEIEENLKSCFKKLTNLNLNKAKEDFDLDNELSLFSWKERNMFELIFPMEDQTAVSIYNPYINKMEEIDIQTDKKFPINTAIFFKLPYCYFSGGKLKNDEGELIEQSSFYAFRREGPKIFELTVLPDMLEPKSNHCLFEIPYINAICALGGKMSKDVEIYDLEEKIWKNLPELNEPREGAACCVINDTYLYCFFGYDTENSSYYTSIEKLDLVYKNSWELLNPFGNKSFMKRKYCGCVKYRKNFEENIYIVGGINVLNSESKDCLIYNEKDNTIEKKSGGALPYKSSFNCCHFVQLPNGIFYNLTTDCQLIQYEPLGRIFFGIRDN